jgi:hypothetical protein
LSAAVASETGRRTISGTALGVPASGRRKLLKGLRMDDATIAAAYLAGALAEERARAAGLEDALRKLSEAVSHVRAGGRCGVTFEHLSIADDIALGVLRKHGRSQA